MQILKEGISRNFFVKYLLQMHFSPRLKYGVYDCLHIIALDDLSPHYIGLKLDLSFGQHANNEKEHVPCAYFVIHLQQNALKSGFMSIYILLHLVTFDLIYWP